MEHGVSFPIAAVLRPDSRYGGIFSERRSCHEYIYLWQVSDVDDHRSSLLDRSIPADLLTARINHHPTPFTSSVIMTLSKAGILAIVELVLYLGVTPLVLYLTYRHGRHAFLGYLYLNLACGVRIVADIIDIVDDSKSSGAPSLAAIIVGSIGLSPLILALAGFLHEAHVYLIRGTSSTKLAHTRIRRTWIAQLQFHTVTVVGMVLLIIGSLHLNSATNVSEVKSASTLRKVGAVLLLIVWAGLFNYAGVLLFWIRQKGSSLSHEVFDLTRWSMFASILVGVKVIYVMVYVFDPEDKAINPYDGSFAVKVVLTVVIGLAAVIILTIGGWETRDIAKRMVYGHVSTHSDTENKPITQVRVSMARDNSYDGRL